MHLDTKHEAEKANARRGVSATSYAYQQIKTAILEGHYAPGVRLTENDLAADLGVSRTPIREALRQLQSEMLLTVIPQVGLAVPVTTMIDLAEIFEVRWLIEGHAARLAAKRITQGELMALAATQERIAAAAEGGDTAGVARWNTRFHEQVLQAAHNRRLIIATGSLSDALQLAIGRVQAYGVDRMLAEHNQILEALKSGDPQAAETAAREHVTNGLEFHARSFGSEIDRAETNG